MSRYNVQTLSFLIGSFNQMKNTFGENNKTVGFFRSQVEGLIDIKQVNIVDAYLVFELIGMSNTDNVKWETSNKRIQMFITAMNQMLTVPDDNVKVYLLDNLLTKNVITQEIFKIIVSVFDLKPIENKGPSKNISFGVLKHAEPLSKVENNLDMKQKWNKVLSMCGENYKVRVKNMGAVCSCDRHYFYISVDNFIDSNLLDSVIKGATFDIGYETETGDPCHPSVRFNTNTTVTELARKIDFEALRLQMFKLD